MFSVPLHFDQRSSTPQIVELVLALLPYFKAASLLTAKEMALGDTVTQSANAAVLCEDRCKQNCRESVELTQCLLLSRDLPLEKK